MSWVVVSTIIETLAKRHEKDIDNLWDQAEETIRRFAMEDYKNHPQDGLQERYGRLISAFSEMPQYPKYKKSPKFQDEKRLKPPPLKALEEVYHAKDFLAEINPKGKILSIEMVKRRIGQEFPDITEIDINLIAAEIEANQEALTEAVTENGYKLATVIAAKSFNVEPETFERHYLSGARKDAKTFNKLLKQEKEDRNF